MGNPQDTEGNRAPGDFWGHLFDHAFDEIFLFHAEDLHFIQVSQSALRNLGYTAHEIKHLTPLNIKIDLTESQFKKKLQILKGNQENLVSFHALHRRKDGSTYPIEVNIQYLADSRPPLFLAIAKDISERVLANEDLLKDHALLAEAQHMAHIGSCEINLFNLNIRCSRETYKILELSQTETPATLKTLLQAVHPDDRTWLTQLIEQQSVYDVVFRLRSNKGRIKYIHQYCEPHCDEEGRIIRMMSTIQDITQSHLSDLKQKKHIRLLETLSACSEAVMRIKDENTLLKRVCEIIVSLAKYKRAWVGFSVQNAQKQVTLVAEAGTKENDLAQQVPVRWNDGPYGRGPAGTAIRTEKPDCIQQLGTETRYAPWRDAALKSGMHAVLALPLLNDKQAFGVLNICSAEDNAFDPAAIQTLQRLADNLAFGLNTLRAYAQHAQLQRQLQQEKKAAIKSAEQSENLTRRLLDLSRQQNTTKSLTQINKTIQEMDVLITRWLTPEVEVSYRLKKNLWTTEINTSELSDAILNLIVNARRAMPRGGRLVIQTKNTRFNKKDLVFQPGFPPGEYVELKLSDTGSGMTKEIQNHAFEAFFTTKSLKNGTGLGLSMVYAFVKRHQGYIRLFSKPNLGTTFHIFFPRVQVHHMGDTLKTPQTLKPKTMPTGNETVLIVDDEAVLLRLTEKCLTGLGYQTYLAETASQALQIMTERKKIDLLFSDVVMPGGMNGFELAQKAVAVQPELKVLLTSGFGTETLMQEDEQHFSANLLGKPYHRIDLAQRIRSILDQKAEV